MTETDIATLKARVAALADELDAVPYTEAME